MSRRWIGWMGAGLLSLCLVACGRQEELNIASTQETQAPVSVTEAPTALPTEVPTAVPTPEPTATPIPLPQDTQAPVIEGAQDIHIFLGDTVTYRKGITVTDDSGEVPMLTIDTSQVNLTAAGIYPVVYRAEDSSGNVSSVGIVLQVMEKPSVEEVAVRELAEELLEKLIKPEMTDYDKAYTLWNWCRKNIRYAYTGGDRSSVWTGAYEGLHDRYGDCYAYYATYTVLLEACGIKTLCVEGVGGDSNHWWNLVNIGDGWYHCDSSPRTKGDSYRCFMQTDAQVQAYTEWNRKKENYYTFDGSLYPERATEIIYGKTPEKILKSVRTTPAPAVTEVPVITEPVAEQIVPVPVP